MYEYGISTQELRMILLLLIMDIVEDHAAQSRGWFARLILMRGSYSEQYQEREARSRLFAQGGVRGMLSRLVIIPQALASDAICTVRQLCNHPAGGTSRKVIRVTEGDPKWARPKDSTSAAGYEFSSRRISTAARRKRRIPRVWVRSLRERRR